MTVKEAIENIETANAEILRIQSKKKMDEHDWALVDILVDYVNMLKNRTIVR